jgi:hypothetical protein
MEAKKIFISYGWSNPTHEQWVIDLANELTESGVHVILDKWDLKEGHDSVAFMEKMVTDPQITKVAMICDEIYAAKADGRSGGVGTETQIISREVYENQEQGKFVAIIPQRDAQGKAYLPTYYKSRIYIGRRQKLSATPDLSGTVLPLCLIPNSALKNAPPFKSAVPKGSACARLLA